ncbi:type I glyceraldehyde-3-phosphate dehydrogenase [Roseobacter sp.]|uniref:type I glyceraldehyde-3-phosphate dehydrogenase n=1 Tax=Roseobacter sp. TaxID=1907202 RepID=UPI00385B55A4
MTIKLGINGFGRIGRTILRALNESDRADLQVVAINDVAPAATLAHLFEYDSQHGRYRDGVKLTDYGMDVGFGPMRMSTLPDPAELLWHDVDIAIECTGHFTHPDSALRHLENGSKRVLLSAPAKGRARTVVFGVNEATIRAQDLLVSNASCTTNCLGPVVQVLHTAFGVKRGMMTTVHCYTGNQPIQDAPHADLYRARAAALSMIPTTSGAAEALGEILPELAGRITGQAIRVPVANVSCIDLSVEVEADVDVRDVNALFETAERGTLRGILSTTPEKLVSSDFRGDPHSAVIASDQTRVQNGSWIRVLAWYDNEWGFSNRLLDTARRMGALI